MSSYIETMKQQYGFFPADVPVRWPVSSELPEGDQHFLIDLPWDDRYLHHVPEDFREFFVSILPLLHARTTDVHTAICMQYLDSFVAQAKSEGATVNRAVLAYALMLHDSGWSQLTEAEIAASLGVTGLALSPQAMGPKEKHAVVGAELAQKILSERQTELNLTTSEIDLISKAIRYHDQPEAVAGSGESMPWEVRLLVDLDHLWSFTHLNFWQDTLRKGVEPRQYWQNLQRDLDSYFVTEIGRTQARKMLAERERELVR